MKLSMKATTLAAAATIVNAAPQLTGPVTGYTFDVTNFVCKHAVSSNYSM